jgi:hypothetical protein
VGRRDIGGYQDGRINSMTGRTMTRIITMINGHLTLEFAPDMVDPVRQAIESVDPHYKSETRLSYSTRVILDEELVYGCDEMDAYFLISGSQRGDEIINEIHHLLPDGETAADFR